MTKSATNFDQISASMLRVNRTSSNPAAERQGSNKPRASNPLKGMQSSGPAGGIPAHSTASHALLADPRVMVLCEGVLGSQVLRLNQGELEHLFTDAHNPPQRDRRPLQMPWELHVSRAAPGSAAVAPHAAWHRAGHGGPQGITVLERLDLQLDWGA